eukprot:8968938-Pyramimonas_sp.AAC.1
MSKVAQLLLAKASVTTCVRLLAKFLFHRWARCGASFFPSQLGCPENSNSRASVAGGAWQVSAARSFEARDDIGRAPPSW